MEEVPGLLRVLLCRTDEKRIFSIEYAPSHHRCPNGCVPTIWHQFSTVVVSQQGEWNAHTMCFGCKMSWHWTMHPDKPLTDENVVLRARFGERTDDEGNDYSASSDDD